MGVKAPKTKAVKTLAKQDDAGLTPPPTFCEVVRSLLFYVAFYLGSLLLLVITSPVLLAAPSRSRFVPDWWSRWHRISARWCLGIRVVIEGEPPIGGTLVAARHESFFEAIDMPTLFDYPAVFAKAELMKIPIWGQLGRLYGLIPVEREAGARALRSMLAAARKATAANRVLVIFPEGTRTPHGQIAPLQAGFAGIYKLVGLPVMPLAVNSGELYHRPWKRAGTITYRFGEIIPPGLPREEIEARVRAAINVLNEG